MVIVLGIDPGTNPGIFASQCGFEAYERDDGLADLTRRLLVGLGLLIGGLADCLGKFLGGGSFLATSGPFLLGLGFFDLDESGFEHSELLGLAGARLHGERRQAQPAELQVGIVTALIGGPAFVLLVRRTRMIRI